MLYCGDHAIMSSEGAQQGDPLDPLLFCLTTQPLVLKLRSEFKVQMVELLVGLFRMFSMIYILGKRRQVF